MGERWVNDGKMNEKGNIGFYPHGENHFEHGNHVAAQSRSH